MRLQPASSTDVRLTYSGCLLDRGSYDRMDPEAIAAALAGPEAAVVAFWRDRCLVSDEPPHPLRSLASHSGALLERAAHIVFLGYDGGAGVFAADLSTLDEDQAVAITGGERTLDLRQFATELTPAEAAVLGYARGVLHWNRNERFCGSCGAPTEPQHAGHARSCTDPSCGRLIFPRIAPAVIVLVESAGPPERCLVIREPGAAEGRFSTIAGFVEVGESLEEAVRREVREETGVVVGEVRYEASQAWPFPAGIMLGFAAVAETDEIVADGREVVEARWFTRRELEQRSTREGPLGRPDSIDRYLLRTWLDRGDRE